jgi:hypothetical protein
VIDRARLEAARLGVAVAFDLADVHDLGGVPGLFDAVISCDNALPHLLDEGEVVSVLPAIIAGSPRRVLLRLHDWDSGGTPFSTVRVLVLTEATTGWTVVERATRYRAVAGGELAPAAGFSDVRRDGKGLLPIQHQVMIAINPA